MPEFATHELPPPPKPRRPRAKKGSALDRSLKAIYIGRGRRMGDMATLERANGSRKRQVLILATIFFAISALIAWVVFFMFGAGGQFSGGGVALAIEGPAAVKIGEEASYQIRYANRERLLLGKAALEIIVPPEFTRFESSLPPTRGTTWELGAIGKGEEGMIVVRGVPFASLGTPLALQAKLTYTPANINSEFEKMARTIITVSDAPFGIAIEGPTAVGPGDPVTYTITASSTATGLGNEIIRIKLPDRFTATKLDPKPVEGAGEWHRGEIAPGTEQQIVVSGSFESEARGEATLEVVAGIKREGDFVTFRKQTLTTAVSQGELELSLVVNGSAGETSAESGDMLHYNLRYKNRGNHLFGNVSLAMVFRGDGEGAAAPLDWPKAEDEQKGRITSDRVTWGKSEIRRLGSLKPNDEGTIDFAIPIVENPSGSGSGGVIATVEAAIATVEDKKENRVVRSSPLTVTVNTQAKLSAQARYYSDENEALGTGPVPPRVGERTSYRIQWQVKNSLHELADVAVETKLGEGVFWTGKTVSGAGTIVFDQDTRRVVWSVNRVPATVGEVTASFEVAVTPGEGDMGSEMVLTEAATLSGKDAVTQKSLTRSAAKTTTALEGDPEFEGKGVVVR